MKNQLLQYELRDIEEIIPYVNNSRTHSEEQIKKVMASIKEFGFLNPILISEDNVVTAGHCRLVAAQRLGFKKVPCIKENYLTEAQRRAYVIADNKLALDADWDRDLLKIELEELEGADFNLSLLGFEDDELADLFEGDKEVKEDNFDVEKELQQPTISKAGDIWRLGRHRLICGDATKEETYRALLEDKKVNLVLTDPPYNVNYEGAAGKIKNDHLEEGPFFNFCYRPLRILNR